jgi:hypothetical protein
MRSPEELLKLAQECRALARAASNPLARAQWSVMAEDYMRQAEALRAGLTVVRSAFERPQRRVA